MVFVVVLWLFCVLFESGSMVGCVLVVFVGFVVIVLVCS